MLLAAIPAYQEQENISDVVKGVKKEVDEVLVIDDGSDDNTSRAAKQVGAKVVTHEINRGQGAALETGRQYAEKINADFLLFFDGDGQFEVGNIEPAVEKLKRSGADILFGSRFLDDKSQTPKSKKYFLLPIARSIESFFTGLSLTDVHNGFKILSKTAIKEIEITQDRMAHATEIPKQVKEKGLEYIEFPTKVSYENYGQSILGGVSVLRDLVLGRFL